MVKVDTGVTAVSGSTADSLLELFGCCYESFAISVACSGFNDAGHGLRIVGSSLIDTVISANTDTNSLYETVQGAYFFVTMVTARNFSYLT